LSARDKETDEVSNIWIHTFFGVTVAVATVDVPPVEKIVVAMTLVVSHIVFDIIPHGHLSHLKLMSVKKSYLVEAWSGLLIIPLVTWYLAECNFFWVFVCCNAANLFDYFCFFYHYSEKWYWAENINRKIHWLKGKTNKKVVILSDIIITVVIFWFLFREIMMHPRFQ